MNNILIFDTETTGLPPKGAKYDTHYNQFPHIVQLAWWFNGKMRNYIIKPKGYVIPPESTKIHGISHDKAIQEGVLIQAVLPKFLDDCSKADVIVGHNIYFDTSIVKANVLRHEICPIDDANRALDKSKRICTMQKSTNFVGAKQPGSDRIKWPTLVELYYKLFEDTFSAHNAEDDVMATKRCYEELVSLGVI